MANKEVAPLYWDAPFKAVSTFYGGGPSKLGICVHHQAGTATDLTGIFNSRDVSAHYSVGDGYVYQYVHEYDRAWHTGTTYGNTYLIGIETKNSSAGGNWPVSDSSIESLVQCLVGIAQNQGWSKLHWHGDKNTEGYVCAHRDLAATACPGDYLYPLLPSIVDKANQRLSGQAETPVTPTPAPSPAPTPTPASGSVYQVHTPQTGWLGKITGCYGSADDNGSAGVFGCPVDTFCTNAVEYRAHTRNGAWLGVIRHFDTGDYDNGMAGIWGTPIDGIAIKGKTYRVHTKEAGWLGWISQYNVNDWMNGVAGWHGQTIDAIQIE